MFSKVSSFCCCQLGSFVGQFRFLNGAFWCQPRRQSGKKSPLRNCKKSKAHGMVHFRKARMTEVSISISFHSFQHVSLVFAMRHNHWRTCFCVRRGRYMFQDLRVVLSGSFCHPSLYVIIWTCLEIIFSYHIRYISDITFLRGLFSLISQNNFRKKNTSSTIIPKKSSEDV